MPFSAEIMGLITARHSRNGVPDDAIGNPKQLGNRVRVVEALEEAPGCLSSAEWVIREVFSVLTSGCRLVLKSWI